MIEKGIMMKIKKIIRKRLAIFGIMTFMFMSISCVYANQDNVKSENLETLPQETSDQVKTDPEKLPHTPDTNTPKTSQKAMESLPEKAESDKSKEVEIPGKEQSGIEKEEKIRPSIKIAAPFSRHEERYQKLFETLETGGMSQKRIKQIFSSQRAKIKDDAPVQRMSKKVIRQASMRPKKQVRQIVRKIKRHIKKNKKSYDRLEKKYGVNREVAASILFKETCLGEFKSWKHESFTVLNSILSFMDLPKQGPRKKRAERILSTAQKSLEELLLYCNDHNIDILKKEFPSSFAGAVGIPQFMPMYMDYVITDKKNSIPNLSRMPDAILSLGNLMKNNFDWPGKMSLNKLKSIDDIFRKYVEYDKQKGVSFCMAEDLEGTPLKRFVDDYKKIPHIDYISDYAGVLMSYNYSSNYVLDVLHLAYHTHKLKSDKPSKKKRKI